MSDFFTSDPHYFHINILKYTKRPWKTVDEMVAGLIQNYNAKVKPGDRVFFLGDTMFGRHKEMPDRMNYIFSQLNGQKFLIRGNHDHHTREEWFSKHFVWIRDYYNLRINDGDQKQTIILSHFPMLIWDQAHHGAWMLHGHCHGGIDALNRKTLRLDVGVDGEHSNYAPMSFDEVKAVMKKKSYEVLDHHGKDRD